MSVHSAIDEQWLRQRLVGLRSVEQANRDGSETIPDPDMRRVAAVLVPIVLGHKPMVILTRRSALLRTHPGQISFPGGRPDAEDRDLATTALRETWEEIGLASDHVAMLGALPPQNTFVSNYVITPFVGLVSIGAPWQAAPDEVEEIFGLDLEVLLDPQAPRRIEDGLRRGSWSWPHPDHDIWGATAGILVRLADLLRAA